MKSNEAQIKRRQRRRANSSDFATDGVYKKRNEAERHSIKIILSVQ